jgi:hypothetical protein
VNFCPISRHIGALGDAQQNVAARPSAEAAEDRAHYSHAADRTASPTAVADQAHVVLSDEYLHWRSAASLLAKRGPTLAPRLICARDTHDPGMSEGAGVPS